MQEIWEFDIPTAEEHVTGDSFRELLESKSKEIGIYLSYYYRPEGGIVEQVRLKEDILFTTPTTGRLTVDFFVIYYNACLNINSTDNKDQMSLKFEIDPLKQKVKFTGPYWPQREPDGL